MMPQNNAETIIKSQWVVRWFSWNREWIKIQNQQTHIDATTESNEINHNLQRMQSKSHHRIILEVIHRHGKCWSTVSFSSFCCQYWEWNRTTSFSSLFSRLIFCSSRRLVIIILRRLVCASFVPKKIHSVNRKRTIFSSSMAISSSTLTMLVNSFLIFVCAERRHVGRWDLIKFQRSSAQHLTKSSRSSRALQFTSPKPIICRRAVLVFFASKLHHTMQSCRTLPKVN